MGSGNATMLQCFNATMGVVGYDNVCLKCMNASMRNFTQILFERKIMYYFFNLQSSIFNLQSPISNPCLHPLNALTFSNLMANGTLL